MRYQLTAQDFDPSDSEPKWVRRLWFTVAAFWVIVADLAWHFLR